MYTPEEEQSRIDYIPTIRKNILSKIDDLRNKIESNEPCPEMEQNIDMLVDIDDYLENCLNNWYY